MLYFEGYPDKAEDMEDHYHWTLVDEDQCRLGRPGTLQANISQCGYYTAAWDWSLGPPRQKVRPVTRAMCASTHLGCSRGAGSPPPRLRP